MRTFATLLTAVFLISTSGCATMLKGTTDQITVISDPSGANVSVNDTNQGTTPTTFAVPSKQDLNIEVSKPGYESQALQNQASFFAGDGKPGPSSPMSFPLSWTSRAALPGVTRT
jgi:PEGA domain